MVDVQKKEKEKRTLLHDIVCEKKIQRVFVESGGRLADDVKKLVKKVADVVTLVEDHSIRAAKDQLSESFRVRREIEKARMPKSRFRRWLKRAKCKLYEEVDKYDAKREHLWALQINREFVEPSLVYCGKSHLSPGVDIIAKAKLRKSTYSGKLPELLRNSGYSIERIYLEPQDPYESDVIKNAELFGL